MLSVQPSNIRADLSKICSVKHAQLLLEVVVLTKHNKELSAAEQEGKVRCLFTSEVLDKMMGIRETEPRKIQSDRLLQRLQKTGER